MTVKKLINMAGGLTPKSYTKEIEIVRYYVDKTQTRRRKILHLNMREKNFADIELQPYDEVRIFTIPKWGEKKVVTLSGQIRFPGRYTIETGEKLSSVIERAGGFTKEAFIEGAVFTRESVRESQLRQYNQTLARIKRQLAIFNAMPANAKQSVNGNNLDTLNQLMIEAKKYQPIGRISIKLDKNLKNFEKERYNLVLENQDTLSIPSQKDTVTVFGEVFNPTSFVYNSNLSVENYIQMASGFTRGADQESVYVVHADGTSEPIHSGWLLGSVEVKKGDTIVVPLYIKEYNQLDLWESVSKIMASFAITAATLTTLGVF
jgi:protein involved in polysaccharide export with SLBB domain